MEPNDIEEIQVFDLDTHSERYCIGRSMVISGGKSMPDFDKLTLKRVGFNGDTITFKVIIEHKEPLVVAKK